MGEFYYRVIDNSMAGDRIYAGDQVLVTDAMETQGGCIFAIASEQDISQLNFRRVVKSGDGYLLVPSNPEYTEEMKDFIMIIGSVAMSCINA